MAKGDWKYKLANSLQGRYGVDEFSQFLIIVSMVFLLVDIFTNTLVLYILGTAGMLFALYRAFSRNVKARRRELEYYSLCIQYPKAWLHMHVLRWKNRKTTKYFMCKQCGQLMSVPKGAGKIRVTCPKCKDVTERRA
jgi:membrane-bound ClpP family serine protease